MDITFTLNKTQADALFAENAIVMCGRDVIPDYKVAELFGYDVCAWAESCMKHGGFMVPGADYNSWSGFCFNFFLKSGFDKLVSQHNSITMQSEYANSKGGKIWAGLWEARSASLAALDAEEDRKREERKAKRAAARKAKQEAAEKAASV